MAPKVQPTKLRCNSTYRLRYWNNTYFNFNRSATISCNSTYRLRYWNSFTFELKGKARIPLAHGCNSTYRLRYWNYDQLTPVFTILMFMLQQYLPFTVLKPSRQRRTNFKPNFKLQQYLPFTVLKRCEKPNVCVELLSLVAIVFTACGIETLKLLRKLPILWIVATVLTIFGMWCMMRITKIEFL